MQPYGHTRRDQLTCHYGCCAFKYNIHRNCRKTTDRARRKRARQQARKIILNDMSS